MKRTYTILSTLLLALLFAAPVFAQEATEPVPTQETVATEVAAPPAIEPVTDNGFFAALFSSDIVWQILIALAMLLLFRSVPKETLDKLEKRATETDSTADDMAIKVLRWLNANKELLPDILPSTPPTIAAPQPTTTVTTGGGQDTTITVSQPPVTVYPTPSISPAIQTTEFVDTFGKRGDNSYTWNMPNHAPAVIEIPDGYDYHLHNKDGSGKDYPYKAVNTNNEYGTRLNVAFTAGIHQFFKQDTVQLGVGRHELALSYAADVKQAESGEPMHNWLWVAAYVDGQPVVTGLGNVNHRALENGAHVATWVFDNLTPRTVALSFHVVVHWGSALGDSTIDLQAFGLKQAG